MHRSRKLPSWLIWLFVVPATLASLAGAIWAVLTWWKRKLPPSLRPVRPPDFGELAGLTDEEAAARRVIPPEDEAKQARKAVIKTILRRNAVSIFNVSLLALAAVTLWLGDTLGALTTLGVMLANIVVNTVQQVFAVSNVEKIAKQSRPKVSVLRSGKMKSVPVEEIVAGDVVIIGLGEQILTEGIILRAADNLRVDRSAFAVTDSKPNRRPGDKIQPGWFCVQGWAAYEVLNLPPAELRKIQINAVPQSAADLTPLQKIIDRILRILLGITAIFFVLLIHSVLQWDVLPPDIEKLYRDVASIVFSVAPSGLFFMIIVAYNMGAFDILKIGALVRDSRSVESLAQITTICFGKSGTLTGIDVQLEMLPQAAADALDEHRIRQIVGDYVHSIPVSTTVLEEMRKNFEGQPRTITAQARLLVTHGWTAVNFNDPDLQGTYVLGLPDLFVLPDPVPEDEETVKERAGAVKDSVVQNTWGRVRSLFRRGKREPEPEAESAPGNGTRPKVGSAAPSPASGSPVKEEKPHSAGIFSRIRGRVTRVIRREKPESGESAPDVPVIEPKRFVFAYTPEEQPLFDEGHAPTMPQNLTPLCTLVVSEQVRPEARDAVRVFADSGVAVKIISQDKAREVEAAARQLGLDAMQGGVMKTLTGEQIRALRGDKLRRAVRAATIIAPVTSQQKGEVVRLMRESGEFVAMTGAEMSDVPAMREANLSVAVRGGVQAAISFADIVLIKESLQALPQVLRRGRMIVNGLLDVLKLNLVQVVYIFFLLVAMVITRSQVFYYDPTQGGLIVFFAIVIPSVGLTFWASRSPVSPDRMLPDLLKFILPVGLTSALASLFIFYVFRERTGNAVYAQLGVTYVLSLAGMITVLFVRPPNRFWGGGSKVDGDLRFVVMLVVMVALYIMVLFIPLAQKLLKVAPLARPEDYQIVAGVILVWILATRTLWLLPWLRWKAR